MNAGYSGTPLAKKLGIKPGSVLAAVDPPDNYLELLSPFPDGVRFEGAPAPECDIIHFFTNDYDSLRRFLPKYKQLIKQNGAIWVSWYKKASRLPTEITEDAVRAAALPLGLVDVKVCAVDENWSGLKLVIRRENRL